MIAAALGLFRAVTPRGWLLIAVLTAFLLFGGYCAHRAAQGVRDDQAGQTLAEGRTGAAQDASAVRDRADDRTASIDNAVQDGTDEIRNAPDRASANAAALHSLCRLNPSADSRCGVLNAPARRVD